MVRSVLIFLVALIGACYAGVLPVVTYGSSYSAHAVDHSVALGAAPLAASPYVAAAPYAAAPYVAAAPYAAAPLAAAPLAAAAYPYAHAAPYYAF